LCACVVEVYPRTKLDRNPENFVDGHTDVLTHMTSVSLLEHHPGNDLKIVNMEQSTTKNVRS